MHAMHDDNHLIEENARLKARIAELEAERVTPQYFNRIFENTPFGIILTDEDGQIIYANSTLLNLLGYTLAELQETRFERHTYNPDLWQEQRFIEQLRHDKREFYDIEKRYVHRNGRVIPVRLTMLRLSPYAPVKYLGVVEDISPSKQSADLLNDAQLRFQSLVETVPALVFLYEDGQITYANPVTERVIGAKNLDRFEKEIEQVIHEERPAEADFSLHEMKIRDANNKPCWLALRLVEAGEEFQQVLIGTALDVTEHKIMQEREAAIKREQERARVLMEFITNFSHDVRTPLSTIKTSLFLVERTPDEEKRSQKINIIDAQVDYIQQQVDDILMLLRVDTEFYAGQIDLLDMVNALVINTMPHAQEKKQQLQYALPTGRPYVKLDGILVRTALDHLLSNAVRYTQEGGKIHFDTRIDDDYVRFVIRDNGPGIPEEFQHRVFESFYRIDGARHGGGTGMGLAIASRIAQKHGGKLTLKSEVGKGCEFSMCLPVPN